MKVLFVQDSLGTGGAEKSNSELWYFLRDKKISIKIIVLEHRQKGIENEILSAGFDVTFIDKQNFWQQVNSIAQIIKEYQPDIVHSVLFRASLRTRLAKLKVSFFHIESLVNCTYDVVRFSDPKVNKWGLYFYKFIDRITQTSGTDKFIAITNEVRLHYHQKLGIPLAKIEVIYRGRKANPFLEDRAKMRLALLEELKLSSEAIIITHVGRQEFQKGHLELLQAIKSIDNTLKERGCQFIFCGRDGNNTADIKAFLAQHNLKTGLSFLGHRHDVNQILAASDIFVFPSKYEGLGGSLIEAQAAALPIVCSNIKVFEEVVIDLDNALRYQLGDINELAQKILLLVESAPLREKMGKASLSHFNEKFQLENVNCQMLEYYENYISKSS